MESLYQSLNGLIPGLSGAVFFWLIVVLVVAVVLVVYVRGAKLKSSCSVAIEKSLRNSVTDTLSAVSLIDEAEGEFHYDFLCLTPSGIIVVDVKDFKGLLFGGTGTDQWTQVIGSRSYKFENPLYHNREKIQTIKTLIEDEIPVFGCVIFTTAGSFPKDQPDGVFTHDKFDQEFRYIDKTTNVQPLFNEVWLKVKSQVAALSKPA